MGLIRIYTISEKDGELELSTPCIRQGIDRMRASAGRSLVLTLSDSRADSGTDQE